MDLINDLLNRIAEKIGLPDELRDMLEHDLRIEWGGMETYINKIARHKRDAALLRDWRNGERIRFLQRRYDLSASQVYNIIGKRNAS